MLRSTKKPYFATVNEENHSTGVLVNVNGGGVIKCYRRNETNRKKAGIVAARFKQKGSGRGSAIDGISDGEDAALLR